MTHIEREKTTVARMVALYCRKKEGGETGLCRDCEELLVYARKRLDHCPYGNAKPSCKKCTIHCYKPNMREHMRAVMRFAGPRMLFYHPADAIKYLLGK